MKADRVGTKFGFMRDKVTDASREKIALFAGSLVSFFSPALAEVSRIFLRAVKSF